MALNVIQWSESQVVEKLEKSGLESVVETFKKNGVDGRLLLELSVRELKEDLGIIDVQAKTKLSRLIKKLKRANDLFLRPSKKRKIMVVDKNSSNSRNWTAEDLDSLTNYFALYGKRYELYLR